MKTKGVKMNASVSAMSMCGVRVQKNIECNECRWILFEKGLNCKFNANLSNQPRDWLNQRPRA